jgi:hypothetical protein
MRAGHNVLLFAKSLEVLEAQEFCAVLYLSSITCCVLLAEGFLQGPDSMFLMRVVNLEPHDPRGTPESSAISCLNACHGLWYQHAIPGSTKRYIACGLAQQKHAVNNPQLLLLNTDRAQRMCIIRRHTCTKIAAAVSARYLEVTRDLPYILILLGTDVPVDTRRVHTRQMNDRS